MRHPRYSLQALENLFRQQKVVTLAAMKAALGHCVKMTVFRLLQGLPYRSSFTHAGQYYTLDPLAHYDKQGLWFYQQIGFSRQGSLLNTLEQLVCQSRQGCLATELEAVLQVRVQAPLLKLVQRQRLKREWIAGEYLYLSPLTAPRQLKARQPQGKVTQAGTALYGQPGIREALNAFLKTLNERQRRLYVGFESMKLGPGGDQVLSQLTGLSRKTIRRGRHELAAHQITTERVRRAGAGRPRLEKKTLAEGSGGTDGAGNGGRPHAAAEMDE